MRTVVSCLIALCMASKAMAQCGMGVTGYSNIQCMSGFVDINTTGGTPPYTLEVRKLPQNTVMGTVNDADGDYQFWGGGYPWEASDGAHVTVTDATNCTATMDVAHTPFTWAMHIMNPPVLDCATGIFRVSMNWFLGQAPNTYRVDNGPVLNILGNWTNAGLMYVLNTVLAPGAHTITFPQTTIGGFTYCETSNTVTIPAPITPGDCNTHIRVRMALDGALPNGTLMTDALRAGGLIPATEPYSAMGYIYAGTPGGVGFPPALLSVTGNNAIVDWVVVEVREATAPYTVQFSKPALLQRDGDVIDTDGDDYVAVGAGIGTYNRVAVRHRNHLGVMSAVAYQMVQAPVEVNFRNQTAYGTNAMITKGGVNCLWAGDVDGNGTIAYTGAINDRDQILGAIGGAIPTATLNGQYRQEDVNLDGVVKYVGANNDRDPILQNIGGTTPTNTRIQQLP